MPPVKDRGAAVAAAAAVQQQEEVVQQDEAVHQQEEPCVLFSWLTPWYGKFFTNAEFFGRVTSAKGKLVQQTRAIIEPKAGVELGVRAGFLKRHVRRERHARHSRARYGRSESGLDAVDVRADGEREWIQKSCLSTPIHTRAVYPGAVGVDQGRTRASRPFRGHAVARPRRGRRFNRGRAALSSARRVVALALRRVQRGDRAAAALPQGKWAP